MTGETQRRVCATCGKALGRGNATGYCSPCLNRFRATDENWRKAQREGVRRKLAVDPAFADALKERARSMGFNPETREARSQRFRRKRVWEMGNPAQPKGSEARRRAGRSRTETIMAWCPRELREDYFHLTRSKGLGAAEARAIIEAQHEAEMERFRRKIEAEVA